MATSPGGRGGQTVLETGIQSFSRMGAKELVPFSLPSFFDNFKEGKIVQQDLLGLLKEQVNTFENSVNQ
jgi:chromate reductase